MLTTLEQQKQFYNQNIKNCITCNQCAISSYCIKNKFNNDLNMCCWNIFQKWLKDEIMNLESEQK